MNQPDIATIVREHQAGVWRYLRFLGCDEHDADELTQATFIDVLRKGFEHQGEAKTKAFLRSKARFLYLSLRRTRKQQVGLADIEEADVIWQEYERDNDGDDYVEAITRCMEALDERSALVIRMQYREDRGVADISYALGIGESNVKAIAMRARESLRKCIERKLGL
ncbi:MAG: RNA polymerase sigma factor [Planctomycetaceae bacterium]|nr:RNA polymerase sigma factor [Planctomycetaceae bacterium]